MTTDIIRADFDRISRFDDDSWNHNNHYHSYLLEQLPSPCAESLEIGCGTGSFARLLAQRSQHVVALDLSPRMVEAARERSRQYPNIEYLVADALMWMFPVKRFDCIASIATLHHLILEIIVPLDHKLLETRGRSTST